MEVSPSDIWFQQVTLMDAISSAEHLHVFMEHADRVLMAGLAQSTNVIHSLFFTNSSSGGTELVKTPAFYVFKMFVPHHVNNARWMPSTLESEDITGNGRSFPVLSSAATVNDAGELSISLVNVDLVSTRDVTVTVDTDLIGYTLESAEVITADAKDSYNDFGATEEVNIQPLADTSYALCGRKLKVSLPSKSVVMFRLTPLEGSTASTCPAGAAPPAGTCTESAELCTYGETQCACQAGQQDAAWQCGSCPAMIANGDVCSVTGMTCGMCTCEQAWEPGGQRSWAFACVSP
jgi:hypothetical protein